jgi:CheY-like chemotaxis protein
VAEVGFKILIIEDDANLGSTLREALTRKGHFVFHVTKPDEAMQLITKQVFNYILVDCLLPQITGVELIKKIQSELPPTIQTNYLIMSGIYTDKTFQQEAIQETKAVGFLKKPFGIDELDQYIKKMELPVQPQSAQESPRKKLYEIFEKEKVSPREKRKLIESLEEVDGYDLPFIYSLLAETKTSGHLNIFTDKGTVSGVTFYQGLIVGVDVEDQSTFLGHMLIQSGYLAPQDLKAILDDKSPRRIGQKLIEAAKLSPHAFDKILNEQMNVRLTRTISDGKVRVNFVSTEVEEISPAIDSDQLLEYLHDWVASKIPLNWLESLYLMWSGQKILKSSQWRDDHPVFKTSFLKRLKNLPEKISAGANINDLLAVEGYDQTSVHKALHLLLLKGLIIFSAEKVSLDAASQRQHIKKLHAQIYGKESAEVLELFNELLSTKPETEWLDELMKFVGPAPTDAEVLKLWQEVKDKFDKALRIHWSETDTQVTSVRKEDNSEKKLKSMRLIDDAKAQLQLNRFAKASELLEEVTKIFPQAAGLRVCKAWAQLGSLDPVKKLQQLKEVELEMMQIPPDERYDALYPFVMGLYQKAKGDTVAARKSFEKAQAIDPALIAAKREISLIDSIKNVPKQDVFNMDLKDVVAGFFKKKSG